MSWLWPCCCVRLVVGGEEGGRGGDEPREDAFLTLMSDIPSSYRQGYWARDEWLARAIIACMAAVMRLITVSTGWVAWSSPNDGDLVWEAGRRDVICQALLGFLSKLTEGIILHGID